MPSLGFSPDREGRRAPALVSRLLTICAAFTAGCGGGESLNRVPMSGTVFTTGTALKAGTIRFVPIGETKGPTAVSAVIDGAYAFTTEDGPVPGTYRVEVVPSGFLGFDPGDQEAAERAMKAGMKKPVSPVPPGYGAESPLKAEVAAGGAQGLNFLLTAKRPAAGGA